MHPLLLHSVSYSGSWGQAFLPVEEFVAKAASLGFDGVMLMAKRPHVSVLDYGAAQRAELRRVLEGKGLEHVVIAGYCNLTADLEHRDIPTLEMQVQYIGELTRLARDVGASAVRVFTGYEHPLAGYAEQWGMIVRGLREAAARAAELGVVLGVQNHHDMAAGYQSMRDLIDQVGHPNCRAMFDAWAPALHGDDLRAAASALGDVTIHTTAADYQLRPRYRYQAASVNYEPQTSYAQAVPMGEGFIEYAAFFEALMAAGFEGSIGYEMCSPLLAGGDIAALDGYARRFVEYMIPVRAQLTRG